MKLKLLCFFFLTFVSAGICLAMNSQDTLSDAKKVAIQISPNPVTNELTITVTKKQLYQVNLYNPNGAIIRSGKTESIYKIDMSKYEKGDYVVEVIELATGNGYMKKVVKE